MTPEERVKAQFAQHEKQNKPREWVALTKEDIAYLGIHTTDMYPDEFIKFVEAKCREKNT
jgi:hypothetical protein